VDNYVIDPDTGCWIWQGYRDPTGYPYQRVNEQYVSARRWHYEQQYGPIPEGRNLLPQCDQRVCVCPTHMQPAPPRDIVRAQSSTRMDVAKVREIRSLAGQVPQRVIAEQFGISQSHVNQIIRGKRWREEAAEPAEYRHRYGRLTFVDAERIRDLAQTMSRKDLAAQYGVSESTISLIVSGKRWAGPHDATLSRPADTANAQTDT
jgi:transcriptional regulator with XRE-family HTH domain